MAAGCMVETVSIQLETGGDGQGGRARRAVSGCVDCEPAEGRSGQYYSRQCFCFRSLHPQLSPVRCCSHMPAANLLFTNWQDGAAVASSTAAHRLSNLPSLASITLRSPLVLSIVTSSATKPSVDCITSPLHRHRLLERLTRSHLTCLFMQLSTTLLYARPAMCCSSHPYRLSSSC